MASSARTHGRRQARRIYSSDMLSQLPEEIQRRILSFLPTIDAARTGFCSKLLRTAWRSVPKLIFDYYQFPETAQKPARFLRFIYETLHFHDDSHVRTFEILIWLSMDCCMPIESMPIDNEWIIFAVAHNVENLVLCGRSVRCQKLPDCIFSCQSLVKLELAVDQLSLVWPETFKLPNLRKLKLKFMLLSYPEVRRDLFSSFPALEKLSIMFCQFMRFSEGLYISSCKLKEFIICNCPGMEDCCFRFETPCLDKYIYICPSERESQMELPDYTLGIIIKGRIPNIKIGNANEFNRTVVKLSRELFKGYLLRSSHWLIEYLCMIPDLPKQMASLDDFSNLYILDIDVWSCMEHLVVAILLISKCPTLRIVCFEFKMPEREPVYLPYLDRDLDSYDFQGGFGSISHININNFSADELEMTFLKALLAHTSNLILMRIYMNMHMVKGELEENISKILAWPKASEFADVIFE